MYLVFFQFKKKRKEKIQPYFSDHDNTKQSLEKLARVSRGPHRLATVTWDIFLRNPVMPVSIWIRFLSPSGTPEALLSVSITNPQSSHHRLGAITDFWQFMIKPKAFS